MDGTEIKIKMFKQIDSLDKKDLEQLYGMFLNFLNGKVSSNNWDDLSEEQKKGLETGIYELDSDQGIPNDVVMEELRKKYGIS